MRVYVFCVCVCACGSQRPLSGGFLITPLVFETVSLLRHQQVKLTSGTRQAQGFMCQSKWVPDDNILTLTSILKFTLLFLLFKLGHFHLIVVTLLVLNLPSFLFLFFWDRVSCVAPAGLCFHSSGTKGIHHNAWPKSDTLLSVLSLPFALWSGHFCCCFYCHCLFVLASM